MGDNRIEAFDTKNDFPTINNIRDYFVSTFRSMLSLGPGVWLFIFGFILGFLRAFVLSEEYIKERDPILTIFIVLCIVAGAIIMGIVYSENHPVQSTPY